MPSGIFYTFAPVRAEVSPSVRAGTPARVRRYACLRAPVSPLAGLDAMFGGGGRDAVERLCLRESLTACLKYK